MCHLILSLLADGCEAALNQSRTYGEVSQNWLDGLEKFYYAHRDRFSKSPHSSHPMATQPFRAYLLVANPSQPEINRLLIGEVASRTRVPAADNQMREMVERSADLLYQSQQPFAAPSPATGYSPASPPQRPLPPSRQSSQDSVASYHSARSRLSFDRVAGSLPETERQGAQFAAAPPAASLPDSDQTTPTQQTYLASVNRRSSLSRTLSHRSIASASSSSRYSAARNTLSAPDSPARSAATIPELSVDDSMRTIADNTMNALGNTMNQLAIGARTIDANTASIEEIRARIAYLEQQGRQ